MRMNGRERTAVRELIASGIACIIDIGRAIKNGSMDDRANAVAHTDTFLDCIDTLQMEPEDEARATRSRGPR